MAQRMCLSEHPFGTSETNTGSYYFLLRGNRKTQGEFALFFIRLQPVAIKSPRDLKR